MGVGVVGQMAMPPAAIAGLFNSGGSVSAGDYSDCAEDLVEAGVTATKAADLCAAAFDPDELADCATDIGEGTTLSADAALAGCIRVRRPEELADCVVDVDGAFEAVTAEAALGYCTRSLVPERFADCATGLEDTLGDAADLGPQGIMDTCIDGDYTAGELFIPGLQATEVVSPDATMPEVNLDDLEVQ
ncbi:MAG: hypothetical protein AAF289_06210 [Cyanobacteria bacterium P01_A01_bin.135]